MEARVITRIEPTRRTHGLTPIRIPELRKVAGYARVSTESEEQENSYEAQVRYFTNFIQNHEGWTFAGMYTEEERSYPELLVYLYNAYVDYSYNYIRNLCGVFAVFHNFSKYSL